MTSPLVPRCGPAGWANPNWSASVYPRPRPRGFHPLRYLAEYFDTVEIDASFDRPLRPEISRLWVDRVSDNQSFLFTAKLGRRFTHERELDPGATAAFKEGLWPILKAGRLGAVVMQFPWSFRFTAENREFFIRLRRMFHEFPLAAEMRHSSWLLEEAVGTFIDYRIGFCNIDQPEQVKAMPPAAVLTSALACFRLHGRGENYLYSAPELEAWKSRIDRIAGLAGRTLVTFTNDAGGRAAVNALQMQARFDNRRRRAPAALVARFPGPLAGFRADRAVQEMLFTEPERAVA
jgi:uncharacterized protein YecE (DUF72 family)